MEALERVPTVLAHPVAQIGMKALGRGALTGVGTYLSRLSCTISPVAAMTSAVANSTIKSLVYKGLEHPLAAPLTGVLSEPALAHGVTIATNLGGAYLSARLVQALGYGDFGVYSVLACQAAAEATISFASLYMKDKVEQVRLQHNEQVTLDYIKAREALLQEQEGFDGAEGIILEPLPEGAVCPPVINAPESSKDD